VKALRNHVKRNWRAAPTAKVKNSRALWKETKETLDMGLIVPTASAAVSVP
jgi:hypothetical protein